MRSIIRRTVAMLATLSLGAVFVAQASAQEGQVPETQPQQQEQQQQEQQQEMTLEQKAKFYKAWSDAKTEGAYDQYVGGGLMLTYDSLGAIVEELQQQPVGGGPEGQQREQLELQQIQPEHQKIKQNAGQLSEFEGFMEHPQKFKEAADATVNVLTQLQEAQFPKLERDVRKVDETAQKIKGDQPLAAQDREVKNFFKHTSAVINKMSDEIKKGQEEAVGGGPETEKEMDKDQKKEQERQNKEQQEQQEQMEPRVPQEQEEQEMPQ